MEYRNFGSSGLETSVIGFGGWPMGKGHYGSFDEKEVIDAVHAALDIGITLFDTAPGYGSGAGEKLLGQALHGRRDDIVLVSKGGLTYFNSENRRGRDSSYESLSKGLEDTLSRLDTDYLDVFLIHWPDESRSISEPMEAISKFQEAGKIRFGGVSNFSSNQMKECVNTFPIVTNQVGYHLFDFRPEEEIFPFCQANDIGAMAYGSLAHGLLTGTMTPDTEFEENDWRKSLIAFGQPIFQGDNFLTNLQKVEDLRDIASEREMTVAQLALAWVISNPVISVALVGTRTPAEIEENAEAIEWVMTPEEREQIRAIVSAEYDPELDIEDDY